MTEPKKVSDFAREYQQMYIANVQLNSAVIRLRGERDELQRLLEAERAEVRRLERLNALNI